MPSCGPRRSDAGKLMDIDGRRIQLDCRASGTRTVLFEYGLNAEDSHATLVDGAESVPFAFVGQSLSAPYILISMKYFDSEVVARFCFMRRTLIRGEGRRSSSRRRNWERS